MTGTIDCGRSAAARPPRAWPSSGLVLCAGLLAAAGARAEEGRTIVARVDGEPVTLAELRRMVANPITVGHARQLLGDAPPDAAALEALAMRRLVRLRLLQAEARRRGIDVAEGELDREIAGLRRRFGDLREFGAWMQEQGLDERTLFDAVRADVIAERTRAALIADVTVSPGEVDHWYRAHLADLGGTEVALQLIAVGDEAAANELVAALRRGAEFGRLARERSRGLRAAQGGSTGWVDAEDIGSPLRETVAAMKPGEARGPLQRGSDWLLVRMVGRRPGEAPSLADVRASIEKRLLAEKRERTLEVWFADRERTTRVEVDATSSGAAPGAAASGVAVSAGGVR
jgi:parvulin-like peptidyl-prolyl isomerase